MILSLDSHPDLDENHKTSWALFGMVAFGVGEVFGGFIMGITIDKFGSKTAGIQNVIIAIIMTAVTITCIQINEYNYMTFIMCFIWGYLDGSVNIHCFSIMGFQFVSKS